VIKAGASFGSFLIWGFGWGCSYIVGVASGEQYRGLPRVYDVGGETWELYCRFNGTLISSRKKET
jgi:hypothetical protein